MFTSYSAMVTWLYTKFDYSSDVDNATYKFKDKLLTWGREYDVMFEVDSVYGKHSHKSNIVIF